jgi:hypothetical protein
MVLNAKKDSTQKTLQGRINGVITSNTITGKVTDQNNQPLSGVLIRISPPLSSCVTDVIPRPVKDHPNWGYAREPHATAPPCLVYAPRWASRSVAALVPAGPLSPERYSATLSASSGVRGAFSGGSQPERTHGIESSHIISSESPLVWPGRGRRARGGGRFMPASRGQRRDWSQSPPYAGQRVNS